MKREPAVPKVDPEGIPGPLDPYRRPRLGLQLLVAAHPTPPKPGPSLDNSTLERTVGSVKTIGVTELRQRAAEVIDDVRESTEPTLVLQRSQKAAYLVGADRYEADQAELQAARRVIFLREVREAEAEYTAGSSNGFEDVEALIRDLKS